MFATLALGLALGLATKSACAQPRLSPELPVPFTAKETPVSLTEARELFHRWEQGPRGALSREVLPDLARLSSQAQLWGVSQLEVLPLLSVMEADVKQGVAHGSDCSAGADSYARLLQTATDEFLTQNAAVRDTVQRLGTVYAGCSAAREIITQVASAGLSNVLIADVDERTAQERQRAATLAREPLAVPGRTPREPLGWPLKALSFVEKSVFDGLTAVGGEPLVRAFDQVPLLNPYSPKFERFAWWCLVLAGFTVARTLHVQVTRGLRKVLRPTSRQALLKTGPRRRKSFVTRRP